MNIKLLCSSTAFLLRDGHYLLLKRSPDKKIAPGVWSGVGGKFMEHELNDPAAACLRELEEETGIAASDIYGLELRYIIIRRAKDAIRQSYIYFGKTAVKTVTDTEEGKLFWIPEDQLLDREFTATYKLTLEHYMQNPNEKHVAVGVAENGGGRCRMVWARLEDFDG